MIGNDIVDLQFFERPVRSHVRYLDRVCTPAEARAIRQSECPSRSLGIVWAGKEAAFKLVSKEWRREHFVPREFVTAFEGCGGRESKVEFCLFYGGVRTSVTVAVSEQWVHAIATFPGSEVLGWRVREVVARSPRGIGPSDESEAIRVLATELLLECGRDETLEFSGRIPVLRRGEGIAREMGISLSHHGAYAAVAIGGPSKNNWECAGARGHLTGVMSSGEPCSICMA